MNTYEIRTALVDATRDGRFGGPVDHHRVYVPSGTVSYFVNGVNVTKDEYGRMMASECELLGIDPPNRAW